VSNIDSRTTGEQTCNLATTTSSGSQGHIGTDRDRRGTDTTGFCHVRRGYAPTMAVREDSLPASLRRTHEVEHMKGEPNMAKTMSTSTSTMFVGSTTLASNLQRVLVDLIDLHIQGKQAHFPLGEQQTATVVDLLVERLNAAARTIREVHDEVDRDDPSTADLLHMILLDLEKYAWMLAAENRSA